LCNSASSTCAFLVPVTFTVSAASYPNSGVRCAWTLDSTIAASWGVSGITGYIALRDQVSGANNSAPDGAYVGMGTADASGDATISITYNFTQSVIDISNVYWLCQVEESSMCDLTGLSAPGYLIASTVQTCFPANALVSTPGGPVEAQSLFIGMTVDCLLPQLPAGLLPSSRPGQVVASDIDWELFPGECEVYYNYNTRHTDHVENFTFAYYVPSGLEPASFGGMYPVIRATSIHNVVVVGYKISAEAPVESIANSRITTTGQLLPGDNIVLRCHAGSCGSADSDGRYYTGQIINVEPKQDRGAYSPQLTETAASAAKNGLGNLRRPGYLIVDNAVFSMTAGKDASHVVTLGKHLIETPVWTKFETAKDGECLDAAVAPCQKMGQVFNTIGTGPSLALLTFFERNTERPNHKYNFAVIVAELLTMVYDGSLSASSSIKDVYDVLEVDRCWSTVPDHKKFSASPRAGAGDQGREGWNASLPALQCSNAGASVPGAPW